MRVGWIGLGQMGAPMASRVLAAGHTLVAHARRPGGHGALAAAGAALAASVIETAGGAEVLCVCLFDDQQVYDALLGQGALAALGPSAILVLHTTGDPGLMAELGKAAPKGVALLDAPFSGTAAMAAVGDLTLLVGGDAVALNRARPVLSAFAASIWHVGPSGAGRSLKMINNLLFAAQVSLADEALDAAEGLGLDRQTALAAMRQSSAGSYALNKFAGVASNTLMAGLKPYLDKDVAIARAALDRAGVDLPLLRAAARWAT